MHASNGLDAAARARVCRRSALNLAACPVTPANVARFAKRIGTPIKVNLLSDKDLPPAVDVWCGICKTVLFAGLASYVVVPYLPHRFQLLTHARPHEHAAVALSAQERIDSPVRAGATWAAGFSCKRVQFSC